jgi:hypothetical protein
MGYNSAIKTVICKSTVPPTLENMFDYYHNKSLYYPKGADYSVWSSPCNEKSFKECIELDFTIDE